MQATLRRRHRRGATNQWQLAAVLILPLLLITPLLRAGLPSLADAQIHLLRAVEWDYLWRNGVFLPTWAPNLAFGYGYPLFNFAPPLPYVIIDGWHWVGLSFETAAKLLSATILYLSCLGGYFFARRTLDFGPALLVAAAHIYTPFVFRQHLLYGGNYPQLLGMALFPWGLWALHRVLSEERKSVLVWTALIVAAGLLSHLFQGFLLIGLLISYVAFFQIRHLFERRTLYAVGGLVLGVALAAYFVVPIFIERAWTWSQSVYYAQKSPIALRFLSLADLTAWPARLDVNAANPWVPFSLGPTILGLAGLGLLTLFWQRRRPGVIPHSIYCALLVGSAVFMMLPESEPVWQAFPFLAIAEFPWRLFGLAILGVAYLAGTGVQALLDRLAWFRAGGSRQALLVIPGLLAILAPVVPLFYPTAPFLELGNPTVADHLRFEMTGLVVGGTNLGEYTPLWVTKQPTGSPLVPEILAGQTPDRLDRSSLPASAKAELLDSAPLSSRYQLSLPVAQTLRFHLFCFPGWQASIDGLTLPVSPEAESGLLLVDVPAGAHSLEVAYHLPAYRWFALAISACALLVLLVLGRSGRRQPPSPAVQSATIQQSAALPRYVAGFLLLLLGFKLGFLDRQTQWLHTASPPGQAIAAQNATDALFGEKIRLIGFDLDKTVYRPGDRMHIRLYWQAEQPLGANFTTFVHLDTLPPVETRATSDNEAPGDAQAQIDIPTSTWRPTGYVRDEHRLTLPAELPPLVYQVRVGVYAPETGERLALAAGETDILATVHVVDDARSRLPFPAQAYRFGESIQLLGYGFAGDETSEIKCSLSATAACQPRVTLVWQADRAVAEDLTVLLHLIGPDGALYGQGDGPPADGRYPTSLWLPGQRIADTHTVQFGSALPAGSYRMLAGFYRSETGERLPIEGPDGPLPDGVLPLRGLTLTVVE